MLPLSHQKNPDSASNIDYDIFPLRMLRGETKAAGFACLAKFGIETKDADKIIEICRDKKVTAFLAFAPKAGMSLPEAIASAEKIMSEQYGDKHVIAFVHDQALAPIVICD